MSEEPLFSLIPPSQTIEKFRECHPANEQHWKNALTFLLNESPQHDESGRVNWMLEGGTAVKLYAPDRASPVDVDFVTPSAALEHEYMNSGNVFGPVSVKEWFNARRLPYSEEKEQWFMNQFEIMGHHGIAVVVMTKPLLAASKTIPYRAHEHRLKDDVDIQLLRVDEHDLRAVMDMLYSTS